MSLQIWILGDSFCFFFFVDDLQREKGGSLILDLFET